MSETPLEKYFKNPSYRDEPSRIVMPGDDRRLRQSFLRVPCDLRKIVELIGASANARVMWFPDANILFREDMDDVWTAFRMAAFGHGPKAVITGVVEAEAKEWLNKPLRLTERARDVNEALASGTWLARYGIPTDSPYYKAVLGYLVLLGLRRVLTQATP